MVVEPLHHLIQHAGGSYLNVSATRPGNSRYMAVHGLADRRKPGREDTVTRTEYIQVSPSGLPPRARFTASPLAGYVPLAVQFTDRSLGVPTAWSWDFGDGNTSMLRNPGKHVRRGGDLPGIPDGGKSLRGEHHGPQGIRAVRGAPPFPDSGKSPEYQLSLPTQQTDENPAIPWRSSGREATGGPLPWKILLMGT